MKHLLLPFLTVAACFSAIAATPGAPTDIQTTFQVQDGKGIVRGQFKAPTVTSDYDPKPLTERLMIDVTRDCWMLSEYDVPVAHIDNVIPGNAYSFIDDNIPAYGNSYTYTVRAYNLQGETDTWGSSASEWAYAGIHVAKPEFVSVTTADKGASPITFTVRAEDFDEDGNPLGMPLTALVLSYSADDDDETSGIVQTVEFPEAGKDYTVTFEAADGVSYDFYLVAECEFGSSESVSRSIFVGVDTPAAPADVKATAFEDGARISWTAPTEGRHHGWIDPAEVRYKVERVLSYYNRVQIADGLTECECFDPCDDLSTLTSLSYAVTAYNALGDGGYASSETLVVGPSAKLPFTEHFNTSSGWSVKADNIWTEVPEEYNWSYTSSTYASGGLPGVNGDSKTEEGYAYCSGYGNAENRLISTPISLSGAKYPVLTFWYGCRPDADNLLAVGYTADGEEVTVEEFGIADEYQAHAVEEDAPVWVRRVVAMPGLAGKTASILFNAKCVASGNNENLCIDEVLLDDYAPVEVFACNFNEGTGAVTWTAPSNSTGEPTNYEVELDGEKCDDTTAPELLMGAAENRDYTVRVRAWYGDIPSLWSHMYVFNPLTTGILSIGVESGVTEYYDLTGTRRNTFTPGEILIRRTVAPDGSVKVSKVKM